MNRDATPFDPSMKRDGPVSSWIFRSNEGDDFRVVVVGQSARAYAWCSVSITRPDGQRRDYRGEGTVERNRTRPAKSPGYAELPISKVAMRSMLGDVSVEARTVRGASEAYASECLKYALREWRQARPSWLALQTERDRQLAEKVERAGKLQRGEIVSFELSRAAAEELLTIVRAHVEGEYQSPELTEAIRAIEASLSR